MYFHGGGFCSGSLLSHRRMVTEAGRAAGVRTLAVGYRLAPEHPFPAALDDALTARCETLFAHAPIVAIGGDIQGGGLIVARINMLRDFGGCFRPLLCPYRYPPDLEWTAIGLVI